MLNYLTRKHDIKTFSVCPENFTGEKGKGGMSTDGPAWNAARDLGQGWKVSPYVRIPAGETFTMADVQRMGAIKHIWVTYAAKCPRNLILRIYWDGQEKPAVESVLSLTE